jgi:hypothetical protein
MTETELELDLSRGFDAEVRDPRFSDERKALLVSAREGVKDDDILDNSVLRFEDVMRDKDDLSRFEKREGCWRLVEAVRPLRGEEPVEIDSDSLQELCENLISNRYGERFYDEDGRRIPVWEPTHREPDDELLSTRHEYVCEKIREAYERLVEHDDEGPMTDTLEEYAEQYGVELPQEVESK